jgi:hypothetical protein
MKLRCRLAQHYEAWSLVPVGILCVVLVNALKDMCQQNVSQTIINDLHGGAGL